MYYKKFITSLLLFSSLYTNAQLQNFSFADGTTEKRKVFYNKVLANINKTLALSFDEVNDEKWQATFYNIGLVQYKPPIVTKRINEAAAVVVNKTDEFKKAFLNLANSNYPKIFITQASIIFNTTTDAKLMAMAAYYQFPNINLATVKKMQKKVFSALFKDPTNAILHELLYQLNEFKYKEILPDIKTFFSKDYLPGQMIVFSLQRKNRNYPGIAIVRDTAGNFIKNKDGTLFNVGQLARSNSNMPSYITDGNTPQGIFKITGYDTSTNYFIGPTTNIQLAMPHEYHSYFVDGKIIDTTWSRQDYENMLPHNFKNYRPLWGTFNAGKAGRTEIIAHGTTIDSSYYNKQPFYPYTPTAGCLCTKEYWNATTGMLQCSDQYKLVEAVKKAGGANGYLIVIEIDETNIPVNILEVKKYLK